MSFSYLDETAALLRDEIRELQKLELEQVTHNRNKGDGNAEKHMSR